MGNNYSKSPGKVHDFSFPFMDPNLKSMEDWKVLEEEKNKALLDKKRFAVRLSDVEELYAKKCDVTVELENSIMDLKLDKKRLDDQLKNCKLDLQVCQIEKTLSLLVFGQIQKEIFSLKESHSKSKSLDDNFNNDNINQDNHSLTESIYILHQTPTQIAARHIVDDLALQLSSKDVNLSRLLQKLHVLQEEKANSSCCQTSNSKKILPKETQNNDIESVSVQNSTDSFGTDKSVFPIMYS